MQDSAADPVLVPESGHDQARPQELHPSAAEVLLNAAPDLLFTVTVPGFRLSWANHAALAFFREQRHQPDPTGKGPAELALDSEHAALFTSWFECTLTDGPFCTNYRSPGDDRVWGLELLPVRDQTGVCLEIACSARDVTELYSSQRRLEETEGRYKSLFDAMGEGAVYHARDGSIESVNHAAERIQGRTAAQMMALTSDSVDWDAIKVDGSSFPADEHPAMLTLRTGQPQSDVVMGILRPDGERRWLRINSQPIFDQPGDSPVAVVATFHDITELRQLQVQLKARIAQLDLALEETLKAMSDMVELRDPYTAGHEREVADIAEALARELGWDDERCRTVRFAALVHDVGKIAIPVEILVKPTRLTAIEYDIVKQHVEFSYQILQGIGFAKPVAAIVYQHHERMNGSGYPKGLKGDEIMEEARVLAVADVVESMSSDRPYRAALGMSPALKELERNSGVLYDARVVDALKQLLSSETGRATSQN